MITTEKIKRALNELTNNGEFYVNKIKLDKKNFGDICVILHSKGEIDIRFIKDKGEYWCEIGKNGEWFFIEDVLLAIGIKDIRENNGFLDMLDQSSMLIIKNREEIFCKFNPRYYENTRSEIKAIAIKRKMDMFGKIN